MIRLFVEGELREGVAVEATPAQAHYLTGVMRLGPGDRLLVFNGRDGEWRARLGEVSKRRCILAAEAQVRAQSVGPDLDLIVALVKRARLETVVEKAAELGARRVRLALTERTNAGHTNVGRLQAIAIEASEQTGRLDVPTVQAPEKFGPLLGGWTSERRLLFCDEAGDAPAAADILAEGKAGPWAILIGPEGGFSPAERAAIRAVPGVVPVSLGPRILRADTAAIAAMSLWQAMLGDWRGA